MAIARIRYTPIGRDVNDFNLSIDIVCSDNDGLKTIRCNFEKHLKEKGWRGVEFVSVELIPEVINE